jgi:hypothetical protein
MKEKARERERVKGKVFCYYYKILAYYSGILKSIVHFYSI